MRSFPAASIRSRRSSTGSCECPTISPTATARSSTRSARRRASSTGAGVRASASSSTRRSSSRWRPGSWSASSSAGAAGRSRPLAAGAERRVLWLALLLAIGVRRRRADRPVAVGGDVGLSSRRLRERSDARRSRRATPSSSSASSATGRSCRAGCVRCATPAGCRSPTISCRRCSRARSSTAGDSAGGTGPGRPPKRRSRCFSSSPSSCRSAAPGWRAFATDRWNTSGALHVRRAAALSENDSASSAYEVRRTAGS